MSSKNSRHDDDHVHHGHGNIINDGINDNYNTNKGSIKEHISLDSPSSPIDQIAVENDCSVEECLDEHC